MHPTILDRLLEIGELFQRDMARTFDGTPLTPTRVHVLWVLNGTGPLTQQALATALEVTPRNVTGLVDALEASGYVRRTPHPTDRRATLVELTELGTRAMSQMVREHDELTAQLMDAVAPGDREALGRGVDAIADRLRELIVQAEAAPDAEEAVAS